MLNRSAIAVTPKQPFLDWLNSVETDNTRTLDQLEKTLYLIPDYEDPEEAESLLKVGYEGIFNRELFAWHMGEKSWPKDRSFELFKAWFDVEFFDTVVDIVAGPIVDTLYE
jgi:hypothetical protein